MSPQQWPGRVPRKQPAARSTPSQATNDRFSRSRPVLSLIPNGGNRESRHQARAKQERSGGTRETLDRAARSAGTSSRSTLKRGHDSFQANDYGLQTARDYDQTSPVEDGYPAKIM